MHAGDSRWIVASSILGSHAQSTCMPGGRRMSQPNLQNDRSRPLALRVTAISIGLLACGLGLAWMVFVHAPPPEEVCRHKMQLVQAETRGGAEKAAEALLAKLERVCVENAERRIRLRNKINYKTYATCVLEADTLARAEGC